MISLLWRLVKRLCRETDVFADNVGGSGRLVGPLVGVFGRLLAQHTLFGVNKSQELSPQVFGGLLTDDCRIFL